ncbi:hypothetical protein [Fusobacterium sp.]|uniref:hypothetical protein n=1 Tax=Fusobacterium sp. TaxID=68766 RepID=UPI0025BBEA92|nr:hypothetical protein [Fusobacterium sp.]MCI5724392.1 hypothetical protein [Fusobacterium sp.]
MIKIKKLIGFTFLLIVFLIGGVFLAKDFILKEILQRKLTKMNNAPVYIEKVYLSPLDNYVTVKDIKITSALNKESLFITIDEFKSYYSVDYLNRVITLNDTEIENIVFFEEKDKEETVFTAKNDIFSNKMTEAEENFKKDQVLSELKNLYFEKIDIDSTKIDAAIKDKYEKLENVYTKVSEVTGTTDFDNIKDSFKKLKDIKKSKNNLSEILGELSKIGQSSKNISKNLDIEELKLQFNELKKSEQFKELLDTIVKEFLNKNKFVLLDLDTYINLYLNAVYEEKIYKIYLKYLKLISEIDRRKFLENIEENKNDWELYFKSISLTSNMYGINFNGEIKNLSSKISKNTENVNFKLFGEKGQTIGEMKGYVNFDKYQTELTLNIPELNSVDFNKDIFYAGEGTINQYSYTDNYFLHTEGTIYFKNLKVNGEELVKRMKIEDDLVRELVTPLISELKGGEISYKYDTKTRKLTIQTDLADVFDKLINDDNASLKIKMREKIKEEYLNKYSK